MTPITRPQQDGEVIVAGHVCLDVIPRLHDANFRFRAGALETIGEVTISPGGCVSNTGLVLAQLGVRVQMVSRIGDDMFGTLLEQSLSRPNACTASIRRVPGEHTSYSLILSPAGHDRMILHSSGTNDTFGDADVSEALASTARLFHFGYPPLMKRMYSDGGRELVSIFRAAKQAGKMCSLDMAFPDPASSAAAADWREILSLVLQHVDVFLPSYHEILAMLYPHWPVLLPASQPTTEMLLQLQQISSDLLGMGAGIVAIKLGDLGLYLRTASHTRLAAMECGVAVPEWAERELWATVFESNVVGTNGAGDATVAGFLFALLRRLKPEDVCSVACAVGACSVQSSDATSGVPSWEQVERRMSEGWRRRTFAWMFDWPVASQGVFCGPLDRREDCSI